MTKSAAEVVRAYYDAFNGNDLERFLSLLSEDVVHDINQGGSETGRAAFAAFMRRMARCYREQIVDLVVFSEPTGKRVAAEFTVLGQYTASDEGLPPARGQRYRIAGGSFFEVRDGKIARVASGLSPKDAIKTIDAKGLYVTPGLIDLHVHVYNGTGEKGSYAGDLSVPPDGFTFRSGVTTVIDAGCAGWRNFEDFKDRIIDRSKTRVLAMLNIVGNGMRGGKWEQDMADMDGEATAKMAQRYLQNLP